MFDSTSLPISMIRQFLFCPRIPYLTEVMGVKPVMPLWTSQGDLHHRRQVLLSKNRTLSRFDLQNGNIDFDVQLASECLRMHGICDAVVSTHEQVIPIDFKLSDNLLKGHILQVALYGILLQEKFELPCNLGFVLLGPKAKAKAIDITGTLKSDCWRIVHELHDILERPFLPNSSASNYQCCQCEFINYCNDRF